MCPQVPLRRYLGCLLFLFFVVGLFFFGGEGGGVHFLIARKLEIKLVFL